MKTNQVKLFVYWKQYDWQEEGDFEYWDQKMSDGDIRFFLCEVMATIPEIAEPTREEVANRKVSALRIEAEKLQAETHMKLKVIEDKIQQLLCLPAEVKETT